MNPFISLSLFVILLSFFIILNAHSSYDETKARPILNSLSMVFTNQQSPADINASETNRKGASEGQGNSIDKIEGLFSSEIAGVKAKQNRMGTELRMRLPFSVFEQKIMSSLSGNAAVGPAGQQAFSSLHWCLCSICKTKNPTKWRWWFMPPQRIPWNAKAPPKDCPRFRVRWKAPACRKN